MSDRPTGPAIDRPLPSSFDDNEDFFNENGFQKITRKLKQEPLIPLGCLLTVAAFTSAYRAMRRGDHQQVNRMFRARVAAQGFTVLAMVAGGYYYGAERNKERELWRLKRDQDAEEKKQKWIRELEARDEEDKLARERLEKRRARAGANAAAKREAQAQEAKAADASAVPAELSGTAEEGNKSSGGGVLGALGSLSGIFGSSSKKESTVAPPLAPTEAKKNTDTSKPANKK